MQKVNFNLLPFSSYRTISSEDVLALDALIHEIKAIGDMISVPTEFYTSKDANLEDFTSVIEKCYEEHHDELSFLIDLVCQNRTNDVSYKELFEDAQHQNDNRTVYTGFVKDSVEDEFVLNYLTATDENSLRNVYRHIAIYFTEYMNLYSWRNRCFPKLLFTQDAFDNSEKIGFYQENYPEIRKCLSILNDEGLQLYFDRTEDEAIRVLQSKTGIHCSGKGANESSTFKKQVVFQKSKYEISCIPHFKLDAAYSNKRLHFCWGRDEIACHRIIIAHVGEHWKKDNSRCSVIE